MKDVITFQGKSVEELETAIVESVDYYLEWCKDRGKTPEKPFPGRFDVRTNSELHSKAVLATSRLGLPLNKYVEKAIEAETKLVLSN
ncbi:MAG: type II toxin-antitoxin system HicB family antitoxin [Spirochaetales bacterium]|nr:type II toxin-antitoxin system HicB family antitoxin [Spirochaetales bacterium]